MKYSASVWHVVSLAMLTNFIILILFIIDSSIKTKEWLNCQGTQAFTAGDTSGWEAAPWDIFETQKLAGGLRKKGGVASGFSP